MTYEVLVTSLRKAAGRYRDVADKTGEVVAVTHVEPDSLGHVELAAWLQAVADQCDKAHTALGEGAHALADGLDASAATYEATDEDAGSLFRAPLGSGPLSTFPTGPEQGPGQGPGQGPVYGPPVPGASGGGGR